MRANIDWDTSGFFQDKQNKIVLPYLKITVGIDSELLKYLHDNNIENVEIDFPEFELMEPEDIPQDTTVDIPELSGNGDKEGFSEKASSSTPHEVGPPPSPPPPQKKIVGRKKRGVI